MVERCARALGKAGHGKQNTSKVKVQLRLTCSWQNVCSSYNVERLAWCCSSLEAIRACLGHALACAHRLAWAWLKDLRRQPEGLHVCEVHLSLAEPWLVRGKQARLSQRQQLGSIVQADGGRGRGKLQLVAGWACV